MLLKSVGGIHLIVDAPNAANYTVYKADGSNPSGGGTITPWASSTFQDVLIAAGDVDVVGPVDFVLFNTVPGVPVAVIHETVVDAFSQVVIQ